MTVEEELIEKTGLKLKRTEPKDAFHMRLLDAADADSIYSKLSKATREWVDAAVTAANAGQALPDFPKPAKDDDEEEKPAAKDDDDEEADDEEADSDTDDEEEEEADEPDQPAEDDDSDSDTEKEEDMPSVQTAEETPRRGRSQPVKASGRNSTKATKTAARTAVKAKTAAPAKAAAPAKKKAAVNDSKQGGVHYVRTLLCKQPDMTLEDIHAQTKRAGYDVAPNTISTTASNFRYAARALQEAGLLKKKMY